MATLTIPEFDGCGDNEDSNIFLITGANNNEGTVLVRLG
jgi:hypothetical protein